MAIQEGGLKRKHILQKNLLCYNIDRLGWLGFLIRHLSSLSVKFVDPPVACNNNKGKPKKLSASLLGEAFQHTLLFVSFFYTFFPLFPLFGYSNRRSYCIPNAPTISESRNRCCEIQFFPLSRFKN